MLVGYMRVSTEGDRQTFDLQRDALLSAGVDERHLFEDRVSGNRGERTGLAKALAFIKAGDCLVVWKLDRLGRSLPHLLSTVTYLKTRGIGFRSFTEQMDTATPQGEFLLHVFGALAQFERSLIQERIQAGLAAARRRGRRSSHDNRRREAGRRDLGARRRGLQGRRLPDVRNQAQHAHRRLGGSDGPREARVGSHEWRDGND
jgi:DNA invertase Pin-like site-specific DNA recombinase